MIRVLGSRRTTPRAPSFEEHDGLPRFCWEGHWFTTEDMLAAQFVEAVSHGLCPEHAIAEFGAEYVH